mmetsp:Transcript_26013/g.90564  ORF Transcript_26013/g.90564 Transcript_26013/m.90564 type:complete len:282 (-) Transcript_26013:25-870(-)
MASLGAAGAGGGPRVRVLVLMPTPQLGAALERLLDHVRSDGLRSFTACVCVNHHMCEDVEVWRELYRSETTKAEDQAETDCRSAEETRLSLPAWKELVEGGVRRVYVTNSVVAGAFLRASSEEVRDACVEGQFLAVYGCGSKHEGGSCPRGGDCREWSTSEVWFPGAALTRFQKGTKDVEEQLGGELSDLLIFEKMGHSAIASLALRGGALSRACDREVRDDEVVEVHVAGFDPGEEMTGYYYKTRARTGEFAVDAQSRTAFKKVVSAADVIGTATTVTFW